MPCVRQTCASNSGAFDNPAVLDFRFCDYYYHSSRVLGNPSIKNDVGRNLSFGACLPHTCAGDMETQLNAVSELGAATSCGNRPYGKAA